MVHTSVSLKKSQVGFTLLEVMIVMVIVGIAATIVFLSMGDFGASRRIKTAATDLSLILPAVAQQAIFKPAILGVRVNPHSYRFYEFITIAKTGKSNWVPLMRATLFKAKTLPNTITLTLKLAGNPIILPTQSKKTQPQIVFLPDGSNNAFTIGVGKTGSVPTFNIVGSANGAVTITAVKP